MVGLFALKQVKLAQAGLRQAREMEARRLELENAEALLALVQEFNSGILPAGVEAWDEVKRAAAHSFDVESKDSLFSSKYPADFDTERRANPQLERAVNKTTLVLNRLEHFALSVQALNDPSREAAYAICGGAFVGVTRSMLTVTVHVGSLGQVIPVVRLYREWQALVEKDRQSAKNALIVGKRGSSISEWSYDLDSLLKK